MYIYCDKCKWTQDDFWHEEYTPFSYMYERYHKEVLDGSIDDVMEIEKFDKYKGFIGMEPVTIREFITREMEHWVKKIQNQRYITIEQYRKENPDRTCPVCHSVGSLIED